jgi:glycosyltransferase involved in cell wall biosynthesis
MPVKVSVVVPVYNPGPYIEPCVESLLAQTMSPDELELIFVDDGSTDDSPERLDRLAAEHPHVKVIHIPNSGWPGKPRNVGTDAALGEYVQYVDQDDAMGAEALERMYTMGKRNDADIVFGKVTSDFRGVPHGVFRRNVESCTIETGPLIDSLTPHKMFRKAFLQEHGIRYPEGKRRLEDQLFLAKAYFPAKSVSIVGDYPCYFYKKRADGKNAGSTQIEPVGYYGNLREVLDVVHRNTEPGDLRNKLLRRFYRGEMLSRLSEPAILKWSDGLRRELFDTVRELAHDCFPDEVPEGLPVALRVRARLLQDGRLDDLVEFARRCAALRGTASLDRLEWRDGRLVIGLTTRLENDGAPLSVIEVDGRQVLDPALTDGIIERGSADVRQPITSAVTADVFIRERDTSVEWFVPAKMSAKLMPAAPEADDATRRQLRVSGTATLNPLQAAGGAALPPGTWEVWLRLSAFGLSRTVRVGAVRGPGVPAAPQPAMRGAESVVPYYTEASGDLNVDVGRGSKSVTGALRDGGPLSSARRAGNVIEVVLPVVSLGDEPVTGCMIVLSSERSDGVVSCWLPATVTRRKRGLVATTTVAAAAGRQPSVRVSSGRWDVAVGFDPRYGATAEAGHVVVRRTPPTAVLRWRGTVVGALPKPVRRRVRRVRRALRRLGR